ncbi:hypothetical protein INS49_015555 [Diaporthe citri]|uniref:uncharacterized protein n=1 Tax=Diaporthe citri TaxID=83186 RepID=UPI001C81985F|nr:uncharacterized protein INS49_015555 [Diaporthe citri]KAG6356168.1 hypothetical protein INS49_015555 [Diaporthe citri]
MDPIEDFVAVYRRERDQWECLKNRAFDVCNAGLKQIGVMSLVTSRVKNADSLKKKLDSRNNLKAYSSQSSIMDDQLDFVGLRIALYFPHQKGDVIQMLKLQFQYGSMRPFDRDWKPEDPGIYQNLFGQYVADHVWVSLREKDQPGAGKYATSIFEIQLRSVLMDAWAGISQDLTYKAFSGDPTARELKLLDALKGHVEVGELVLEQLYHVHQKRLETENEPILSPRDLREVMVDSLPESQISEVEIGDLDALLLALRGISADTPLGLRGFLRSHGMRSDLRGELRRFHHEFQPVPPTIAFCFLQKVVAYISTREELQREVTAKIRRYQDRAWWDSRYWQPLIWLSLKLSPSLAVPSVALTASQVRKYVHLWCAEHYGRTRASGTFDDECVIDCFHRTKEGSALAFEFVAELCTLGLGPTEATYMEEHEECDHEDDRFTVIANAMHRAYTADSQAWVGAVYDFNISLRNHDTKDTYSFLHSTDVALWLLSLDKIDLLVELLKEWPLGDQLRGQPKKCLEAINKLAETDSSQSMLRLLRQETGGFIFLDIES